MLHWTGMPLQAQASRGARTLHDIERGASVPCDGLAERPAKVMSPRALAEDLECVATRMQTRRPACDATGQSARAMALAQIGTRAHRDVARAFARVFAGLWVSTVHGQQFYRVEYTRAHVCEPALARAAAKAAQGVQRPVDIGLREADPMAACGAWLDDVARAGQTGWRVRVARDALSLLGNVSLLGVIGERLWRDAQTEGDTSTGLAAANQPFGVPWMDWLLLSAEGLKGLVTQSLGSPTLIRHHAVDELLQRLDVGCLLLEQCLPPSDMATGDDGGGRDALDVMTRARDVATVFTFANSAVPPARMTLWLSELIGPQDGMFGRDRGLLRIAGLALDTCRALTSLAGTWARHQGFEHDARTLQQRWHTLSERLAAVPEAQLAGVMLRVSRVMRLAAHCDTALLKTMAGHAALCDVLLTHPWPFSTHAIERACRQQGCHAYGRSREVISA